MQGGIIRDEGIAMCPETTVEGRAIVRGNRGNVFEGVVERACEITPGGDSAVHVHDKAAEPHLLQPFRDGFDGGSLLSDEEHTFASGDERRDEVSDGLGLASTRRALN